MVSRTVVANLVVLCLLGCQPKGTAIGIGGFGSTSSVKVTIPQRSTSSSASLTSFAVTATLPNGLIVPSDLGEFDCFAINVIGGGIKSAPGCGGDAQIGFAAGFVARGSSLEIDVPMGAGRIFQVWGFAKSKSCADVVKFLVTPKDSVPSEFGSPGFLLAEKTVDVSQRKMTVDMDLSFRLGTSKVICGSLNLPDTSLDYINPVINGSELATITDVTSATTNCIGYKTTASSPIFKCYMDGTEVTCAQGACASYSGGYVHRASGLAAGTHVFKIETYDNSAGLSDPDPTTRTFTVDTAAPTMTLNSISPGGQSSSTGIHYTNSQNPIASITLNEAATVKVKVGSSGTAVTCTNPSVSGTFSCPITPALPTIDASTQLTFSATDKIGWSATDIVTTLVYDGTAPSTAVSPSNLWLFGGDIASSAAPGGADPQNTDATGEVDSSDFFCTIDNASPITCPTSTSTISTFSTKGGRHVIALTASDLAGNYSTTLNTSVYIDSILGLPLLGRLYPDGSYMADESTNALTIGNLPLGLGLNGPGQVALDTSSNRLYVTDSDNNRVLVFSWNPNTKSLTSYKATGVFGQPSYTTTGAGTADTTTGGITYTPMRGPAGISVDVTNRKLFVADTNNHRVLRFDISTGITRRQADLFFGQAADTTSAINVNGSLSSAGGTTTTGLYSPVGLHYDVSTLYVADRDNCRVVAFQNAGTISSSLPTIQYHLGASAVNPGAAFSCPPVASTGANNLSNPTSVWVDAASNKIYVADTNSNRVAIWTASTAGNGVAASDVIGQASLTATTEGDASSTSAPTGVAIVFDTSSTKYLAVTTRPSGSITTHKVKLYSLAKTLTGTWNSSGTSGATTSQLNSPGALFFDSVSRMLFVTDVKNHRVGIFPTDSISDDMLMTDVVGHTNFTGTLRSFTASGFNNPNEANLNGAKHVVADTSNNILYVSDTLNHRILVYNLDSTTLKPKTPYASAVLGVKNYGASGNMMFDASTTSSSASSSTLYSPGGLALDSSNRLYVADTGNNRVVRFPTTSGASSGLSADLVLGQSSFVGSSTGTSSAQMNAPMGVAYDSTSARLFVTDTGNKRVLVFASVDSAASGASAASTIGTVGVSGTTASLFQKPEAISYTSGSSYVNRGIFVTDRDNHRVNYYDLSTTLNTSAYACYGHRATVSPGTITSMCTRSEQNDIGYEDVSTNGNIGLNSPQGVFFSSSNDRLYISDTGNKRVVVYDMSSSWNQPSNLDVTSLSVNYHVMGGQSLYDVNSTRMASSSSMKAPTGIIRLVPDTATTNVLYIVDPSWHRVGVYEVP